MDRAACSSGTTEIISASTASNQIAWLVSGVCLRPLIYNRPADFRQPPSRLPVGDTRLQARTEVSVEEKVLALCFLTARNSGS